MKGGIEKEIKSLEERRNKYLKERTLKKDMAKKISWLLIMMLAAFLLIVGIVTANRKEDLHAATRANHGFWYAKVLVFEKGADPTTAKPLLEFGAKYTPEFPVTQYGYLYSGGPHYYMPPLTMDRFKDQSTLVGGTEMGLYQKDPNSIKFADKNGRIEVKKIFISTSSTRPTSRTQMKEYNSYAALPRSPKTPSGEEKWRDPVDQPRYIEVVLETTDGGDTTMPPVTPPPGTAEPQPLTFTLTNEQAEPLAGVRFMLESLRKDKKTWSQFAFNDTIINNNNNGKGLSEQWDTNNKNYYITDSKGQITLTPAAVKEMMYWGDLEDNDLAFRFRQVSQALGYQAPPPYSGEEIEETNSEGQSLNGFVTQPVMITSEVMNERAAQGWTSMNTGLTNKKLSDTTNLLINPTFVQVKGGEAIPSWNTYFSNFYVDNIDANPIDLSNKSLYNAVGPPGVGNYLAVTKETLNNNIGPWRLSGSGINDLVVDQPKGTANSAGLISIYNQWETGEYVNQANGTAAMLVTGDWNTISAPNPSTTAGISLIFGQVINVTPGKTYRFGTTSDVWEQKVNESDAPKMNMYDASVQVRISPEQKITGEGGVNYYVTNEPMKNYGLYTTYKVPEGVNQVTLSIRLKLRKYAQWNMLANLKDAYFEEMEDGGTGGGGGNGGGTGGGGTSQPVTVEYYRDGKHYGDDDETKTGALGSSWTVGAKNWSGYTFDHAEVTGETNWIANQIPFSGYFSTTATTVKVYYKSNTVEPTWTLNVTTNPKTYNQYETVNVNDSWLKNLVNVSLKDSSNPAAAPTLPASYEVTLVSPPGSTVDTSTARVITYTVNITAKDKNGTSYTKNGVEIPITIKEVTSYKLEVDPQTIDLWEGDSQPNLKEVFKGAVKVVVDQGTAKDPVTLSDNQYDIAVTSTWNNSATLQGAPRTFTVKVTPTPATVSDYHGLKEVSGSYLLVNFKVITYELQATGIPQEYWSNDPQPSAADRLKWVKDVKVKPSNTEAVDAEATAVDITGIKGGSATNQVDMTKLDETIIYLVTVTAENPLKNNESIKVENIEIPITIIAPPTYQLKINVVDADGNPINYESVSAPFGFARESSTSWDTAATTIDNVITFTNGLEIQSSYQIEQSHVLAEQTDQQYEDITDNTGSVFPPGTGIKPPPGLTQELHTSSLIETYPWNKQEPSAAFRISRDESVLSYGSKTYDTNTTDSIELADGLKAKYDKDNHILELTITNDQGELVLAVPDLLFQQGMPGALKDQILGRKEDEQNPWSVKVKDTLQTNQNWNLEAKLTDPFTLVGENREIKDILVYKETPAATQQLMQVGQAIDVLDKSKAGEPDANQYYVKTWDKQAGFLLNIDKQKSMGIKEGEYTATIEFTLKDAD